MREKERKGRKRKKEGERKGKRKRERKEERKKEKQHDLQTLQADYVGNYMNHESVTICLLNHPILSAP